MENNKKNLIVTLADKNFIDQAKQLFSSVYFNSGWAGDYLLLAQGISEEDKSHFTDKGILVYDCQPLSDDSIGISKHPATVLSKFYLFTAYFKKWQKIIFLDADIIVQASLADLEKLSAFNASCTPIWRLGDFSMENSFSLRDEFYSDSGNLSEELKNEYHLDSEAFNSGVFIFDTDLIEENTFNNLLSLYHRFGSLNIYGEEATLNLFFYKKWNKLPIIFNTFPFFNELVYRFPADKFKAIIIHFVCSIKPWDKKSPYYQEWNGNLIRFKEINLNQRLASVKIWSQVEINDYLIQLKEKYKKTNKILSYLRFISNSFIVRTDKKIGLLGLFIKKKSPKLYKLISLKKNDNQ